MGGSDVTTSLLSSHGRLKVKTTAEQAEAKAIEQAKKLKIFSAAWDRLIDKRKKSEYDKEILDLSGEILSKIPDVYTLWNIRKEALLYMRQHLELSEYHTRCQSELSFTENCLQVNHKSYGCWEHRCWLMDHINDPDWAAELTLCNRYLELDERNFHCWDYRRFIVGRSHVPAAQEFQYTSDKIDANFSNFSSWHYRSRLLPLLYPDADNAVGIQQDILLNELSMVQSAFFTDPDDQSAWFYHRWLLGRASKPVAIDLVYYHAARGRLYVRFTKPVNIDRDLSLTIYVGEKMATNQNWTAVSQSSAYSSVWTCELASPAEGEDLTISVCESEPLILRHVSDKDESWVTGTESGIYKLVDFGTAATAVLVNELDMLKQLHDLEPNNKWTMLTIISLMRAVDPAKYSSDVVAYLNKLSTVDPCRIGYYCDMRSKFCTENCIRSITNDERSCNLSSMKLTALYHTDRFLLITRLDISSNALTSLKGLDLLVCLRCLDARHNRITGLDELGILPQLQELYLQFNGIRDSSCLDALRRQPSLVTVDLFDNPIMEPDTIDQFITLLGQLRLGLNTGSATAPS